MQRIGLSKLVYDKTKCTLKGYCELRGLSYKSLKKSFIGKKAKEALTSDGIEFETMSYRNKKEDEVHVA